MTLHKPMSEEGIEFRTDFENLDSKLKEREERTAFLEALVKRQQARIASLEAKAADLQQCCDMLTTDSGVMQELVNCQVSKTTAVDTADVAAAGVTYDQAHTDTLVAMVNELKAKINAMNTY